MSAVLKATFICMKHLWLHPDAKSEIKKRGELPTAIISAVNIQPPLWSSFDDLVHNFPELTF